MDYKDKTFAIKHFEKMKQLWNNKDLILVEGELSKLGVGNDLFDNAKSVKRIIGPHSHAYNVIDDIMREIKK